MYPYHIPLHSYYTNNCCQDENDYYAIQQDRQFGGFPPFTPPGPGGGPGGPGGPPSGPGPGGPPGGPPPGAPGSGPGGGGPGGGFGAPTSPPPSFIPQQQVQTFAVDPGGIRRCLFRYTYIWLNNSSQFWFYPIFVGRNSIAGYRWTGFRWVYFGISLRQIQSFTCF